MSSRKRKGTCTCDNLPGINQLRRSTRVSLTNKELPTIKTDSVLHRRSTDHVIKPSRASTSLTEDTPRTMLDNFMEGHDTVQTTARKRPRVVKTPPSAISSPETISRRRSTQLAKSLRKKATMNNLLNKTGEGPTPRSMIQGFVGQVPDQTPVIGTIICQPDSNASQSFNLDRTRTHNVSQAEASFMAAYTYKPQDRIQMLKNKSSKHKRHGSANIKGFVSGLQEHLSLNDSIKQEVLSDDERSKNHQIDEVDDHANGYPQIIGEIVSERSATHDHQLGDGTREHNVHVRDILDILNGEASSDGGVIERNVTSDDVGDEEGKRENDTEQDRDDEEIREKENVEQSSDERTEEGRNVKQSRDDHRVSDAGNLGVSVDNEETNDDQNNSVQRSADDTGMNEDERIEKDADDQIMSMEESDDHEETVEGKNDKQTTDDELAMNEHEEQNIDEEATDDGVKNNTDDEALEDDENQNVVVEANEAGLEENTQDEAVIEGDVEQTAVDVATENLVEHADNATKENNVEQNYDKVTKSNENKEQNAYDEGTEDEIVEHGNYDEEAKMDKIAEQSHENVTIQEVHSSIENSDYKLRNSQQDLNGNDKTTSAYGDQILDAEEAHPIFVVETSDNQVYKDTPHKSTGSAVNSQAEKLFSEDEEDDKDEGNDSLAAFPSAMKQPKITDLLHSPALLIDTEQVNVHEDSLAQLTQTDSQPVRTVQPTSQLPSTSKPQTKKKKVPTATLR